MKILVRLSSDLTVKSDRIRAKFVGTMLRNMTLGFRAAGIEAEIQREWSRLYVTTDDPRATDVLSRTFGISSFSVIEHECAADLDTIAAIGASLYTDFVRGKTFAVRARRVGDHPFTSMDVAMRLGAALRPVAKKVDLNRPEVEVHVEVRNGAAYLFSTHTAAVSGLPLGVSGRGLCLLSGGFDSAVAAWRMMRRGVAVDFLFCNLAGPAYERSVLAIAKLLADTWAHGTEPRFYVLDFTRITAVLRETVKPSHAQVLLKRFFYRTAARVAVKTNALALITGESLGQVSSQTLQNLATIEAAITCPVLRPLLAHDKEEIIREAHRIGTFKMSAAVEEYCQLVPQKPVTACRVESAEREESRFDVEALVAETVATLRAIPLKTVTNADLVGPYLYTESVPAAAVVVDCRTEDEYGAWHYPGAINVELHELLASFKQLDKARTYVLYCPVGLQSAVAAEAMQNAGYQAYSLRGGLRGLRQKEKPVS